MSGYLRDSQLRRQLEDRVKETTRTRQAAEENLKIAEGLIEQARRVDANVVEAEKALAEANAAMSSKDFKLAAEKASEAVERGKKIYRERARAIVDSSSSLMMLAKSVGADMTESQAVLAKAEGALALEDVPNAIDLAKKSWKRSEKVLQEHLSSSFSNVQALILAAKNMSRDVRPIEDLLSRARTAMENNDFQSAMDFTKEGLDGVTEDLTSVAAKEIREAEELMKASQELGADTTKSAALIERARGDVANLEFEKANNAVRQSRAESEKSLQRSLVSKIADVPRYIQEARSIGADPTAAQDRFAKADAAIRKGNLREGAQLAKQAFQDLQQAQLQRVVGVIATSREKFTTASNLGIDLHGPVASMNSAREAIKRNAFREALDHAKRAEAAVDEILDRYRKVEGRLKELHRAFADAEGFGVSTARARRFAAVARQAYQERNPGDVERAVDSAFDELRKSERETVMQAIERAEFILTLGEQNGADLSEPSKLLREAILATKAQEYRNALQLTADVQTRVGQVLADQAAKRISALRSSLPHLGDEGSSLKALINRAEASMASQDFEGVFRAVAEGQTFVEGRIRTQAEGMVGDLSLAVNLGVDLGADVAPLEAIHREMSSLLANGRVADIVGARERVNSTYGAVL
ncbi:MAG TPA: hypothetical protein VJP06_05675, partial [Thermoplasmata archaeon]|nr:hypothetical protein [Thermoplasmata archaeon]